VGLSLKSPRFLSNRWGPPQTTENVTGEMDNVGVGFVKGRMGDGHRPKPVGQARSLGRKARPRRLGSRCSSVSGRPSEDTGIG
jgi:hypothetical protein